MLIFEYLVSDDGDVLDRPVRESVLLTYSVPPTPLIAFTSDDEKPKSVPFGTKIYRRRNVAFPAPYSPAFHREWIRENIMLAGVPK